MAILWTKNDGAAHLASYSVLACGLKDHGFAHRKDVAAGEIAGHFIRGPLCHSGKPSRSLQAAKLYHRFPFLVVGLGSSDVTPDCYFSSVASHVANTRLTTARIFRLTSFCFAQELQSFLAVPARPFLDAFARKKRRGWVSWGGGSCQGSSVIARLTRTPQ
jgi:hypothetical protein